MKVRVKNIILPILFALFVLVRIFVSSPYYFMYLEEAKFLKLAKTLPNYSLYNNHIYLAHPPIISCLIRLFSFFLHDHIAGITVSFGFSILSFILLIKLFSFIGKNRYFTTMALFVFIVSPLYIPLSNIIYKESVFLGLFLLSLYFYIKGLVLARNGYLIGAGCASAACCLTWDLGLVYLLPCFIVGNFVFRKPKLCLRGLIFLFLIIFIFYGLWLFLRFNIFTNNRLYSVGMDGTLEYVRDFNLKQLFFPSAFFPVTMSMVNHNVDLSYFGLRCGFYPFTPLWDLPEFFYKALYIFVAFIAIISVIRTCVQKSIKDNPAFFFSILLFLFSMMTIVHPQPRYMLPILLPIGYLFAEGITLISYILPKRIPISKIIAWVIVVVLVAATVNYLIQNKYLIFALKKEVECEKTAQYLDSLPHDGIMAQLGYPPELAYLTNKRIVALPIFPEILDHFINIYGVNYILYGQHYWAPIRKENAHSIWCYQTIKYIQSNPQKYPLIKIIEENYKSRNWPDRIFIYGVSQRPEVHPGLIKKNNQL